LYSENNMLTTFKKTVVPLIQLPCVALSGVGARIALQLQKLGLYTAEDVLFHLPLRYQDRTRIVPIATLRLGDHVVIEGVIRHTHFAMGKRRTLVVQLMDSSGSINLRFFYYQAAQLKRLVTGTRLRCFAEVRRGKNSLEMIHPEYQYIDTDEPVPVTETLTPIYPTTAGVSQLLLRKITDDVLKRVSDHNSLPDYLSATLCPGLKLMPLAAALRYVHRPPPEASQALLLAGQHPTQQRLAFEELLAHQLSGRQLRAMAKTRQAPPLSFNAGWQKKLLAALPFTPTKAQQRVAREIADDLVTATPMLRLLQGDVGSGKTLVAALSLLQALANGYQAALMAPTELLAEQHYHTLTHWFAPFGITPVWLAGKLTGAKKQQVQQMIYKGEAQLVIGTHALIQEAVQFAKLGLVVIDEQHRFGVHQRLALTEKGTEQVPHQLIMTATPIPRTLSMTAYADLDCSIIDELPQGRTPVKTVVMADTRRAEIIERVDAACAAGRQAYWVCTLIEDSEVLTSQAAETTTSELMAALPSVRIGLIHGRIKNKDKEITMAAFKTGEIQLLVATTVIEVGVDVPNASLMIIENPERLGLAQLHQLRGRVGRGTQDSYCVLLYHPPLSPQASSRLITLRDSHDGFVIAREDMRIRGPGEILGTRQTGLAQLRIADLLRDEALLPAVQQAADRLLHHSSSVVDALIKRWLQDKQQYGVV
jgi:ATP-dependent DNA helicase RecG